MLGFTIGVTQPVSFDQQVMHCVHNYNVRQNSLMALNPCVISSPPTETTDPLAFSVVLPFPEGHIVGIT